MAKRNVEVSEDSLALKGQLPQEMHGERVTFSFALEYGLKMLKDDHEYNQTQARLCDDEPAQEVEEPTDTEPPCTECYKYNTNHCAICTDQSEFQAKQG